MDERELANHVINVVDETAYRHAVRKVSAISIAIGGRRAFDLKRLDETFSNVAHGTVAEGARLSVQVLPVKRHCQNCGHDFDGTAANAACPECDHPVTEAVNGEEVRVVDIQVEEGAA